MGGGLGFEFASLSNFIIITSVLPPFLHPSLPPFLARFLFPPRLCLAQPVGFIFIWLSDVCLKSRLLLVQRAEWGGDTADVGAYCHAPFTTAL